MCIKVSHYTQTHIRTKRALCGCRLRPYVVANAELLFGITNVCTAPGIGRVKQSVLRGAGYDGNEAD